MEYTDDEVKELMNLTKEEKAAVTRFKSAAANLDKHGFWIFSGSGALCIVRCGNKGERQVMHDRGGVDQRFVVDTARILNDGGDWD